MNTNEKKPIRFRRRQVYINKPFQARFCIKFVLVLVLGNVISTGLTLLNTRDTLTSTFANSNLVIQTTSNAIMASVIYNNLLTTAGVSLIMIMVGILVSHKIAGPMFRFEKDIERVATGDLKSRVKLRHGDQLEALATSLNTMIDHLNTELTDIKKRAAAIADKTDQPEACRRDIVKLNEKIDSSFKL